MKKVIAILCSDLHLSEKAPVARSAEPDWFDAQARPLAELRGLAEKYDVPVICAGDIFDSPMPRPPIINFAIDELPHMYAIPGQHDLANHNYDEIERTAYWTLVKAGKITDLDDPVMFPSGLQLIAFPWGRLIVPYGERRPDGADDHWIRLAVIHRYVYTKQSGGYPGAPQEQRLDQMADQLAGYDAAMFGDNHQAFLADIGRCDVVNCGTLMRRKQDERAYDPAIYFLLSDGSISTVFLNTEQDKFADPIAAAPGKILDSAEFIDELQSLGGDSMDFRAAINRRLEMDSPPDDVRKAVLTAVGE